MTNQEMKDKLLGAWEVVGVLLDQGIPADDPILDSLCEALGNFEDAILEGQYQKD